MKRHPYSGSVNAKVESIVTCVAASITGTVAAGTTVYMFPSGSNVGELSTFKMPFHCVVKNLHCGANTTPGAGQTFTYTLRRAGAATALTAVMSNPDTSATDLEHHVTFYQGDAWAVQLVTSASAAATVHGVSFTVERV